MRPGHPGATLETVAEPLVRSSELLVASVAVGICGTDREIVGGRYGQPPNGTDRLILGHEALGRVLEAPEGSRLRPGDLVVPFVRRPDPEPCEACRVDQWDMCRNGRYTEHGIKQLDGFCVERYAIDQDAVVAVPQTLGISGVLVEPASVVAKAWQHIEAIGRRAAWFPRRVLVTGAGPIGLLAAMFAVQRGFEVDVVDVVDTGPKPVLVSELGASYRSTGLDATLCANADIILECTGVAQVVFDILRRSRPAGIVCLTGISSAAHRLYVDVAAVNREIVLENDVVFGSVNANAMHYRAAVDALGATEPGWLRRVVTRIEPMSDWARALERDDSDVKTVISISEETG